MPHSKAPAGKRNRARKKVRKLGKLKSNQPGSVLAAANSWRIFFEKKRRGDFHVRYSDMFPLTVNHFLHPTYFIMQEFIKSVFVFCKIRFISYNHKSSATIHLKYKGFGKLKGNVISSPRIESLNISCILHWMSSTE